MLDPISTLPGVSAAARRSAAAAGDAANKDSGDTLPTAGAPIGQEAYQQVQGVAPGASSRDGVAPSSQTDEKSGFDSTYASLRSSTPAYLAVHDHASESQATDPDSDAAKASDEKAQQSDDARTSKLLETIKDMVNKHYDIGQSY